MYLYEFIYVLLYLNIYYFNHILIHLLNIVMRRNRRYYVYKSFFWPPAEIIMAVVVIVVRARTYTQNLNACGARQKLKLELHFCNL